jgi:hypothetical protein
VWTGLGQACAFETRPRPARSIGSGLPANLFALPDDYLATMLEDFGRSVTDDDLARAVWRGREDAEPAFGILYDRHTPRAYQTAWRNANGSALADPPTLALSVYRSPDNGRSHPSSLPRQRDELRAPNGRAQAHR